MIESGSSAPDPGEDERPRDPGGHPLDRPVGPDGTELSEYAHPEAEVSQTVRRPSTLGGLVYLLVLGAVLAGVVTAALGRWREGTTWIGGAMLAAAVVRLLLPERQLGMLHVRRRLVDVFLMALLGGALVLIALSLPTPPPG